MEKSCHMVLLHVGHLYSVEVYLFNSSKKDQLYVSKIASLNPNFLRRVMTSSAYHPQLVHEITAICQFTTPPPLSTPQFVMCPARFYHILS